MRSFLRRETALQAAAAAVLLAPAAILTALEPAEAGSPYAEYSCGELWMARNGIYANKGYCFKTARAIAVFGPRCYPPFGRLSGSEQRRVSDIRRWERRKGCPSG